MTKKLKKRLYRILLGAGVFALAYVLDLLFGSSFLEHRLPVWISDYSKLIILILFLAAYMITGGDVIRKAVGNIKGGQIFDENFLMSIATIGAFLIGEYPEGVAVMLFYQVGELFQSYAIDKSRDSITSLMDIYPEYANVKIDGKFEKVDPEEVEIGHIILIKPGEKIPLDGRIIKGNTTLDTKALTGESLPKEVAAPDDVISGCINLNGVIEVEVSKEFGESTVSKILELVENASSNKAPTENFITKFSRYYTPVVVIAALFLAVIPPLVIPGTSWDVWVYRALAFLVVSCPCALVISIPLSFFGGLGGASRNGILVKGSNYLEVLASTEIVVFDKTGTLTKGSFLVTGIYPSDMTKEELLDLAAHGELYSNHPISLSLKEEYKQELDPDRVKDTKELSGYGVSATIDGKEVLIGNGRLMEKHNLEYYQGEVAGTLVHISIDNKYAGYILIEDEIKGDSEKAIKWLKKIGIKKTVMLTGDRKEIGEKVAAKLGINQVFAELLPIDKVEKLEEIKKLKSPKGKIAFVGDGINDAPVLAGADVGIAMGGLGSDAAIEAADIVILTDEPSKIAKGIEISKKTLSIAKQNIAFAIGIKFLVLLLAAVGEASMWAAVFADVGVSVIAILNAMRALNTKEIMYKIK